MSDSEYPRTLEVQDVDGGFVIVYEDQGPDHRTILKQTKNRDGQLVDEQLLSKRSGHTLDRIRAEWENTVEDHQDERPPFDADSIQPEPSDLEMAQTIAQAAAGLDDLVSTLEAFLEETFSPDISEAYYDLRKAAEFAMCAAHRTKEIANA